MMKNYILPSLLVFVLVMSSCGFDATKYYTPALVNAEKANVALEQLVAGRTAYIENCKDCHRLFKPSKNTAEKWNKEVNRMQERAKISNEQKANIISYLSSEISQ